MQHIPRKRFGQHFLNDAHIINEIVSCIAPQPNETLIEIGPGMGAITGPLLKMHPHLYAVELDKDLAAYLRTRYSPEQLTLFNADITQFDFMQQAIPAPYRIVGNLPYNITTPIIFHLIEVASQIQDLHFMVQKELAIRMASGPHTKSYGRLSIMTQYYFHVDVLFHISPNAFDPPPKVDSSFMRLCPTARTLRAIDTTVLDQLVKRAFSMRRKQLQKIFPGLSRPHWAMLDIPPTDRPENVSVEQFINLSNFVIEHHLSIY